MISKSATASKRRLGDCLSFVVDNRGKTPPLSEQGIELIEINAIPGNRKSVDFDAVKKHVSEDTYNTWFRKGHPQVGDTLISTVGAIGRVAFVSKQRGCIAQNVIAMRPNVSLVDPGYLFYLLSSDTIQNRLSSLNIGVAQPSLKVPHLLNLELEFPNLPTQRKIAGILSAYDDLIENNLRRIKILEQMAQSLYREWFVHFRFPGHESATFKNSELGRIPDGWEVKEIQEVAIIHRGRSYKSSELVAEGGLPFINLKCVVRDGGFRRDGLKRFDGPYKDSHKVTTGDIVMAVTDMTQERRIVARAARVPSLDSEFGIVSMDLVSIEPRPGFSRDFLYSYFRCSDFADHLKQHANGANVLHLSPDRIKEHEFVLPEEKLMNHYSQIVGLHFDEIENLHRRNDNLRSTRDLLLPKLLSP
jgi:type I restriction enzyme S subunit